MQCEVSAHCAHIFDFLLLFCNVLQEQNKLNLKII